MNKTAIEWTTFSANPLKYRDASGAVVWGCVHASPGCQHCYAEALAKRYGRGGPFNVQTMEGLTPFLDDAELHKMLTAKTIGGVPVSGSRCFVGDMTDIFGEWVPDALLDRLFAVFALRPDVTWQILTKRAERMHDYMADEKTRSRVMDCIGFGHVGGHLDYRDRCDVANLIRSDNWPLANVWLGVSVENQRFADERLPVLCDTPAAVRFISAEPLLGHIDLAEFLPGDQWMQSEHPMLGPARWVIVGGESGNGARQFDLAWARSIVEECRAADVSVFVKQLGSMPFDPDHIDAKLGYFDLRDRKGGNPSEWPVDLRIRQFPSGGHEERR